MFSRSLALRDWGGGLECDVFLCWIQRIFPTID